MTDQDSHRQPFGQVMESMRKYTIALILIFGAHHVNAQYGDVTILNGVSVPSDFPFIDVSILKETALGKIFIANRFISPFMMILENDGTPYFYKRLPWSTHDFKLHSTSALTMWHGDPIYAWVELDSNFNVIYDFKSPGHRLNGHEIQLSPNGNYLVLVRDERSVDMSQVVDGGNVNALVKGNAVLEFDRSRNIVFEWSSWDYFDILDAVHENMTADIIDYVHMNAIAVDFDDHLLISSRHLSEITKINHVTGEIIWRLGGENNQFQFINDTLGFSYQHDIRPVPGKPNQYTLFDNGNHRSPLFTRAIEYQLDTLNWTATKVWEYRHSPDRYTVAWGNAQRLPNGNTLINWSVNNLPKATEVTPNGEVVYEMNFVDRTRANSYRTFRFEWESIVDIPYLIAEPHFDNVTLIFNKFGDKSVTEYRVYGGKIPNSDQLLATTSEPFAQLADLENQKIYYFRVKSVDSNGVESDYSNEETVLVRFSEPGENLILNGDFSQGSDYWNLDISGSASAEGSVADGIYHARIDTGGAKYSDVQLRQDNLELIQGTRYVLEFDAWSSEPKYFYVGMQKRSYPFDYSNIGVIYSARGEQHYAYEFTMDNITDNSARLVFQSGQSESDIYFDNVSLKSLSETPIMGQKKGLVITDFEDPADGVAGWSLGGSWEASDIDLSWVNDHPDNGSLGALRAIVNFAGAGGCCPSFNVAGILLHEEGDETAVAESLTYDVYLPLAFPDGRRAYLSIGAPGVGWVWRHDAYKTMGTSYDPSCTGNFCNEPGADLVAGAWNTIMFPIADAIAGGFIAAGDTIWAGFKSWAPTAWAATDTLYVDNLTLWGIGTVVATEAVDAAPKVFQLSRAYPNPFNPVTNLDYTLAHNSKVSIVIYNIIGQPVRTLVSGYEAAGIHKISWDGTNDAGARVSSGVYLMKMTTPNFSQTQKFTLLK